MEFNLGLDQDLINAVSQIVEASCSAKKMEKEELHPNQVKLDKNKNGKLDSDDFKKLRKEEEEIEEAKDGWSKDDSLAKPVTSGQAMANHSQYFTKVTKLDSNGNPKKPVKEESEDLTEISKKVIGSYVKKASNDLASSVHGERDAEQDDEHDAQEYHAKRAEKRMSGLERAGNKLAKEEVEELDELSKTTLGSYLHKAVSSAYHHAQKVNVPVTRSERERGVTDNHNKAYTKRMKGIDAAGEKVKDKNIIKSAIKGTEHAAKAQERWNWGHIGTANRHGKAAEISKQKTHDTIEKKTGVKHTNEELYLEDYTLEEIQDFMVSEDFEQLDELSKTTLGSYVKKAGQQRVNMANKEKELDDTVNGLQRAKHNVDDDSYSALSAAQDRVSKQRNAVTDKSLSRAQGIHTAIKKLTKEQVEEIEALAAKHGLGE